jgi:hypothetical protein
VIDTEIAGVCRNVQLVSWVAGETAVGDMVAFPCTHNKQNE